MDEKPTGREGLQSKTARRRPEKDIKGDAERNTENK